ncbi:metallophosphoesterase [Enterococcus sp. CWB-B31]|uniref:metallophosphoesterase n=1 Tax=Enterococcus sp. CWB-B31 TaxID=2885159 RepID=UPI001E52BA70|nr:metallophosphoesterase [Enterococcus sp. CWB-B31]MCB5954285.1 metallophosphoesterase [Enterococcus sp. CWB-B31]
MRYLVVSDNHGDRDILVQLVKQYKGKVDAFFHCGDSELDTSDHLWDYFTAAVKGNCDYDLGFPETAIKNIGEDVIFLTHGHLSNVRFGLTQLALQAEEAGANIALFGHTHEIGCEMHQGILFLNPGSIRQPRGPIQIQSYAIIDSTEEQLDVQYYDRSFSLVPELHFSFKK